MTEQWQELKETITELRDNDGTGTQQEVCKFLVNYMDVLEKQVQEPRYYPPCEDCHNKMNEIRKAYDKLQDRPTGHWIWQTEDKYQCSCCGEVIRVKEVMNEPQYIACPMCDARMAGDEDGR